MTPARRKVLEWLNKVEYATPAELGFAVTGGLKKSDHAMKAQGLGRIGWGLASRMQSEGTVRFDPKVRGGHAAYVITAAGRASLSPPQQEGK